ncbi:unnamed protein product [Kluyveromyces dobzhanskii CBS 2104]|uniref:Spindle pole component 29 n=1 Tax=Kluyveromyces dobzhanskii CBS 2104 TaxID=1427455 RepID=A0A0A8L5Q9_9SACH|nr:unnamed protein product [Kluyveromyces dobzhanskii CBS 2104]
MDVSQFLNNAETDDTLQNIRKEYLNSKRTLQELMANQSPTKKMEIPKKSTVLRERNNNDFVNRQEKMKENRVGQNSGDEFLRRQLREGLSKNPEPKVNLPPLVSDSNGFDNIYSSLGKIGELEKRLYQHELQIQALKNELYQSNASNASLQKRVFDLEDHLKMLSAGNHRNAKNAADTSWLPTSSVKWPNNLNANYNGHGTYLDRPQSAPSTSSTSEWVSNAINDIDDTRALLGWKQTASMRETNQNNGFLQQHQRRNLSNYEENTSRLIGLTGQPKN